MGILLEIIDGRLGKLCDWEEKMNSHRFASSQTGFDGRSALRKPRVPCDGGQMNFPMIATFQAPELVGDTNQSIRGDLPSILVDPLTISQPIFTRFLNSQKPRRNLWNE